MSDDAYNGNTYNGADPKCGVTIKGQDYILKRQKKDWKNVITEYVASNVIRELGGNVHETFLAKEGNSFVVLCKDFTKEVGDIKSIGAISESSIDTEMTKYGYYYEDIVYELKKVKDCDIDDVIEGFLKMYVFDTINGNPDRHGGNWALAKKNGVYKFAPIFDNGASLFPRADFKSLSEEWLRERIFTFPNSKIMFQEKRERSNYNEIWSSKILPDKLIEWAANLDIGKAVQWIYDNAFLTTEAKDFYATIVEQRFRVLIRREPFSWK